MPCAAIAFDFVHDGGGVQQRLRRDAADIQADAAERRIALDQHGLHAEVGGAERGRIAARSGAEHQHVAFDVGGARMSGRQRRPRSGRRGSPARVRRRRGRSCAGDSGLQGQDQASGTDLVADLDLQLLDDAGAGRRHLHRRLVGLDRDQRVFGLDRVAGLHRDLDHRHVLEVADVGHLHVDHFVDAGGRAIVGNRRAFAGRGAAARDLLLGRNAGRRRFSFGVRMSVPSDTLSPTLTLISFTTPSSGDGTSIVALSDSSVIKRLLGLDRVTRLHQHFDDRHVGEIADVGDLHFDEVGHRSIPLYRARRMSASRLPK